MLRLRNLRDQAMKRWVIAGGLAALLAAVMLTTFACTGSEPISTEDIGAIYDPLNHRLDAASFVPSIPREEVIDKVFEGSANLLEGIDQSNLEIRTTVGLYAGPDKRGNPVENRKAWLVVVDNIPISFPSGPYTSPENRVDRSGQRQQNQLVVFYDADTGEEIWGAAAGRWVEE